MLDGWLGANDCTPENKLLLRNHAGGRYTQSYNASNKEEEKGMCIHTHKLRSSLQRHGLVESELSSGLQVDSRCHTGPS
jgi:hypothetical protein